MYIGIGTVVLIVIIVLVILMLRRRLCEHVRRMSKEHNGRSY
jgi:nitrate reductase gamma subunit